jgi:16S rRNA (cytosine967-C5)-methyltransferase
VTPAAPATPATPAAPTRSLRSLALGILLRVENGAHAAPLLEARGGSLDPRDRDLLRVLVKRTLREALRLDHVLARSLERPVADLDPPVRAALRLGAAQLLLLDRVPPHAAVSETVAALKAIAPRASGLVNAVLRRVAREEERPGIVVLPEGADPLSRLALESGHPEWLVRRWAARFGMEPTLAALAANEADSPVDILLDPRLGSADEIAASLALSGIRIERSSWAPLAATIVVGEPSADARILSGAIAVVDAAAQALVELLPSAGVVVDLAAAPGGKTRTILARGKARRVVALERNRARALRLARNLAAGCRREEVAILLCDAVRPPLPKGRFSSVLLDAPCSGTGTLRKNPEIRLRLAESDLTSFAARQESMLEGALGLLAPGGTLVYVTCSLEQEENENVVDAVLARRGDTVRISPDPGRLPAPLVTAIKDGVVRILPSATTDGFTATVLVRQC